MIVVAGTYYILNLVNGKIYNGSSCNVPKRLKNHRRDLLKNTHRNRHLQNAANKYDRKLSMIENRSGLMLTRAMNKKKDTTSVLSQKVDWDCNTSKNQ